MTFFLVFILLVWGVFYTVISRCFLHSSFVCVIFLPCTDTSSGVAKISGNGVWFFTFDRNLLSKKVILSFLLFFSFLMLTIKRRSSAIWRGGSALKSWTKCWSAAPKGVGSDWLSNPSQKMKNAWKHIKQIFVGAQEAKGGLTPKPSLATPLDTSNAFGEHWGSSSVVGITLSCCPVSGLLWWFIADQLSPLPPRFSIFNKYNEKLSSW